MFEFGFLSGSSDPALPSDNDSQREDLDWFPSKEVFITVKEGVRINEEDTDNVKIGSVILRYIKPSILLKNAINDNSTTLEESVIYAEKNHSDLIPSKYEGGFKVWECTYDIANYLLPIQITGKTVLDLGCGSGFLGILAMKLGCDTIHFQDYNEDVLKYSTIPNVQINAGSQCISKCKFFSGDWSSFSDISQTKYDLILTSETIYNPGNYSKLHDCFQKVLKPSGKILIGAKCYYFGVGGSTAQFEQMVRMRNIFEIDVVWKCSEGVQRKILQLSFKTTN